MSVPTSNVGLYLAKRIADTGLDVFFSVPGDFNLVLLDQFLKERRLRMIGCRNELNAGYAADGFARERGFAVAVVTFTVGGLSILNAIAGAYSDDLPVLLISGGPNSNDAPAGHLIHHSTGEQDFEQSARCFAPVVAGTFVVRRPEDAPAAIDAALRLCLDRKKPVYLEIACNIAAAPVVAPTPITLPSPRPPSDPSALSAAVAELHSAIEKSIKPVLIAGGKLRSVTERDAFTRLADALGCAIAVTPDAKGTVEESIAGFMGTYWGEVSSPGCSEIVESSDCQIFAGPVFTDYTTAGWTTLTPPSKRIELGPDSVKIGNTYFSGIHLDDLLAALAEVVSSKPASRQAFDRIYETPSPASPAPKDQKLSLKEFRRQVQELLTPNMSLVVETGDSWFNGQKLRLPQNVRYHFQMQYGSIGWATPAALGVALGAKGRTLLLTGDGSFQLTAQEVSTMIREETNPIIFLINNFGYTIEVEIHDGPYNNIPNWDYAGLMRVFGPESNALGIRVGTAGELDEAIQKALANSAPSLIEVVLERDDCTSELLEWGSRVAAANSRT